MLRSFTFKILFYFSIILFGILFLPLLCSESLTRRATSFWANLVILSLQNILKVSINFNNQSIKKSKGYLIAANHQSIFETIFFLKEFDKVVYIVKKELLYIPIYGWYVARLGNIFLNRKERIKSVRTLNNSVERLIKCGYKVIIFPEGTRQDYGSIGDIKPGIFLLQRRLTCSVYPIYINSGCVWPKKGILKSGEIAVKILSPIKKSMNKEKFRIKLKSILEKQINKY